ncbi:MAG: HPF/RaiA family ribosome-associated protein, partial [Patescibacteria group bacterium]
HVILGKVTRHHQKGDIFKAEMNLHISGKVFQASAEEQDLFTAIDIVKDEILKELRTHKDKKIGAIKKGGGKVKNLLKGINK